VLLGVAPLVLLLAGAAAQAWAHHSFAATYLENQTVTIEGELVQFVLRNPHSFVDVDVTEKDGAKTRYVVEWAAPAQLADLIAAADGALYRAKAEGRNRVAVIDCRARLAERAEQEASVVVPIRPRNAA